MFVSLTLVLAPRDDHQFREVETSGDIRDEAVGASYSLLDD